MHVDAAGPATRLPLPRIDSRAVTILVRLPRRPSSRSPAALSRTSFVAQARSGASGNRQTLARSAVTDSSGRSEEHTSELQSLMRNSYAVFCLKKKTNTTTQKNQHPHYKIN